MSNKFNARRVYSELCHREFDSKAEAKRGEELELLHKAGKISGLEYQQTFELCRDPRITITVDFTYEKDGKIVYEDVKGLGHSTVKMVGGKSKRYYYAEDREGRVKRAWLKEKYGIVVQLVSQ